MYYGRVVQGLQELGAKGFQGIVSFSVRSSRDQGVPAMFFQQVLECEAACFLKTG